MKTEYYMIYRHGTSGVCPVCGGSLKRRKGLDFLCHDCGTYFFPLREGQTERELRYGYIYGEGVKDGTTV